MIRRMPVAGRENGHCVGHSRLDPAVEHRNDLIPVIDAESAPGEKIVLHVDDEKGVSPVQIQHAHVEKQRSCAESAGVARPLSSTPARPSLGASEETRLSFAQLALSCSNGNDDGASTFFLESTTWVAG